MNKAEVVDEHAVTVDAGDALLLTLTMTRVTAVMMTMAMIVICTKM